MGNSLAFYDLTDTIFQTTYYITNGSFVLLGCFGTVFLAATGRLAQSSLVALLVLLFLAGSTSIIGEAGYKLKVTSGWYYLVNSTQWAFQILTHWTVAYIYTKVVIETRALLDKDIHLNNQQKLATVEGTKRKLKLAWVPVILLSLVPTVLEYLASVAV
jgi:hypothetical protein